MIGPTTTPTPITAYFRRIFEVNDLENVTGLTLDVVRDDGFVVYINGVEVARDNMPAGPVTYSTRPLTGIGSVSAAKRPRRSRSRSRPRRSRSATTRSRSRCTSSTTRATT